MLSTYAYEVQQNYTLPQIQFNRLNLSSCSISILNQIPTKLLFISQLNLDNNLISSLKGIQQFMNLQVLSVNFNFINQKTQLLYVKNKFLIKELSFIGNYIEKQVGLEWLIKEGFNQILKLNHVQKIYKVAIDTNRYDTSYTFNQTSNRQRTHQRTISFASQNEPKLYLLNKIRQIHQDEIDVPTQRYLTNSMKSSRFAYITKRGSQRVNKQRFQSTGDTRRKINQSKGFNQSMQLIQQSNRRYQQNSKYINSIQSSPNFNKFRQNSFNSNLNEHQQLSNKKRNKISQFKLYPVNEEYTNKMNQQKYYVQKQLINPRSQYVKFQQNYYKRQNDLNRYNKNRTQKYVTPFNQVSQGLYSQDQLSNSRQYIKRFNYKDSKQIMRNKIRSQQSENNIIQKQIPVYKQAIAIAFYYRNILQKVFKGFNTILLEKYQQQQQSYGSQRQRQHQNKYNQNDLQQYNSQNQQCRVKKMQQSQQQLNLPYKYNKQISQNIDNKNIYLLKYAWMKLQLYVNNHKIIDKYLSSNKKVLQQLKSSRKSIHQTLKNQ